MGEGAVYYLSLSLLLLIATIALVGNSPAMAKRVKSALYSHCCVFILFTTGYLLFYRLSGPIYQVWKFASYTLLPLSFIPISLTVMIIGRFIRVRTSPAVKYLYAPVLLVVCVGIVNSFVHNPSFVSATSFINSIEYIKKDGGEGIIRIADFHNYRKRMIARDLFERIGPAPHFITGIHGIASTPDYLRRLRPGEAIVSDALYDGIFRGRVLPEIIADEVLHIYSYDDIMRMGAASYDDYYDEYDSGSRNFRGDIQVLIPLRMRGKEVDVSLMARLIVNDGQGDGLDSGRNRVKVGVNGEGRGELLIEYESTNHIRLSDVDTLSGFVQMTLEPPVGWFIVINEVKLTAADALEKSPVSCLGDAAGDNITVQMFKRDAEPARFKLIAAAS
jgi:hypothetical protein